MKYFKHSYNHLILASFFVFGFFAVHHPVAAVTFKYECLDTTDNVLTFASISKDEFTEGEPESFAAESRVISECSERLINLNVQNKNKLTEPKGEVFADRLMQPNSIYPLDPFPVRFTSPEKEGQYAVRFITGVDEQIKNVCSDGYKKTFSEDNVYHMYDEMMIDTDKTTGDVTLPVRTRA